MSAVRLSWSASISPWQCKHNSTKYFKYLRLKERHICLPGLLHSWQVVSSGGVFTATVLKGVTPLPSEYLQGVAMACKELWFGRPRLFCHSLSHKLTSNLTSSASDLPSSTSLHPQPSSYKCLLGLQGSTSSGLPSCDKLDMRESGSATPSCLSSAEHVTLWRLSGLES